jgi:hypothetical protein
MIWLAVVIAAVVALLAVPVRVRLEVHGEGRPQWRAEAVWLGGLVCIARDAGGGWFRLGGLRRRLPAGVKPAAVARQERPRGNIFARWRAIPSADRQAAIRLAQEVWAATDFAVQGSFLYGCEDPAETAWLYAVYCAARGAGHLPGLDAEADFSEAGWSGRVEAVWSLRPLPVFAPAAGFLLGWAGRRMRKMITGGRRKWQVQV